jgi:hypothetical protein
MKRLALLVVVSLAFAGCGGEDEGMEETSPAVETSPAPAPAPVPAAPMDSMVHDTMTTTATTTTGA